MACSYLQLRHHRLLQQAWAWPRWQWRRQQWPLSCQTSSGCSFHLRQESRRFAAGNKHSYVWAQKGHATQTHMGADRTKRRDFSAIAIVWHRWTNRGDFSLIPLGGEMGLTTSSWSPPGKLSRDLLTTCKAFCFRLRCVFGCFCACFRISLYLVDAFMACNC